MASQRGAPWTSEEIDAAVASYFEMLKAELRGQDYVKAEVNRRVVGQTGRTRGSVERKFQNISAVLMSLGAIPIRGYKPLRNVQQALREAVEERWLADPEIENLMLDDVTAPVQVRTDLAWAPDEKPPKVDWDKLLAPPSQRTPVRLDFIKLEADRRDLGRAGEETVVEIERHRLRSIGQDRLARMVEHVSVTKGDGLGYDILSFNERGEERFIEVKTTRMAREFPFYLTRNEVDFSAEVPDQFHLYRVYDFNQPKIGLYTLPGSLRETCNMTAATWLASPA